MLFLIMFFCSLLSEYVCENQTKQRSLNAALMLTFYQNPCTSARFMKVEPLQKICIVHCSTKNVISTLKYA
jgi:hypothetical protein